MRTRCRRILGSKLQQNDTATCFGITATLSAGAVFALTALCIGFATTLVEGPVIARGWCSCSRHAYNIGALTCQVYVFPLLIWFGCAGCVCAGTFFHLHNITPGCWSFKPVCNPIRRLRFNLDVLLWAFLCGSIASGIALRGPGPFGLNCALVAQALLAFSCAYWAALELPHLLRTRAINFVHFASIRIF